jgi:hypothetical protein
VSTIFVFNFKDFKDFSLRKELAYFQADILIDFDREKQKVMVRYRQKDTLLMRRPLQTDKNLLKSRD